MGRRAGSPAPTMPPKPIGRKMIDAAMIEPGRHARTNALGATLPVFVCIAGLLLLAMLIPSLSQIWAYRPITAYFFVVQDSVWLAVYAVLLIWLARRPMPPFLDRLATVGSVPWIERHVTGLAAGFALILCWAGAHIVYHGYGLSMDEFMTGFQATIFQEGRLAAPIPAEWRADSVALQPIFARRNLDVGLWVGGYLPVNAFLHAVVGLLGPRTLTNAALSAVAVLAVADIARRLWPDVRGASIVAVVLLVTSSQFLITGMTPYAMPGHLALNLVWLWLFLRDDRVGHALAPWVGIAAVGLHQIHVHALFVLPFMLRLLFSRRWPLALYYAALYAVGHGFWMLWWHLAGVKAAIGQSAAVGEGAQTIVGTFMTLLGRIDGGHITLILFDVFRFTTWQNLMLLPLFILGARSLSKAPPVIRDLVWGVLLTAAVHFILLPFQGHGWGFRYLHSVLGSFALVAAYGWMRLSGAEGPGTWGPDGLERARRGLVAGTVLALAVMLPVRAFQIEAMVGPYATASAEIRRIDAEVVVLDPLRSWYGIDLVRNDPFLRAAPTVVSALHLEAERLAELCATYDVVVLRRPELAAFGIAELALGEVGSAREAELSRALEPCLPPSVRTPPSDDL